MTDDDLKKHYKKHCCRVCGAYYAGYYPWGKDGQTPTFDICQCCGVEFGFEDFTPESIEVYQEEWIARGPVWYDAKTRPENWDAAKQLENIFDAAEIRRIMKR